MVFKAGPQRLGADPVGLVTTLLDQIKYPDVALAELYRCRWLVEGCFRDLKATLGLDVLRTRSPALIEREILALAIAYNLTRALLLAAAGAHAVPLARLSFKGALATLRHWTPLFAACAGSASLARLRFDQLLLALAADLLPLRPGRSEPRVLKRRYSSYQLMTRPRPLMRVSASRSL
jgi:hypothetical protein